MTGLFTDMFEYNRDKNREMIVLCLNHENRIPEKVINLFSHSLNAHHLWNQRILGKESRFGVWDLHIINSWNSTDQTNFTESMEIIRDYDLERMAPYRDSKGNSYENKIRDILFHVVNHSTYHRAQIVTALHEQGIQPGKTDYIFYKR